jgi:undecaprenyl phosphate N,N'-diacetylbacillosamine 1-phosphate transferase
MYIFLKNSCDFVFALVGLLILAPLFLIISIILYLDFKESPFFFQKRVGKNNKVFSIVKYKTMKNTRDEQGLLLPDEQRLTRLGTLIRKTSLDEIPQLVNVLKGEMSFVGPRPLLESYLPLYNEFQKKRHLVRPGITGWTQINGRNGNSWEQKFEYDVWYVHNISFLLDVEILFKTVKKVFISEGISAEGQATTTAFKGTSE